MLYINMFIYIYMWYKHAILVMASIHQESIHQESNITNTVHQEMDAIPYVAGILRSIFRLAFVRANQISVLYCSIEDKAFVGDGL